MDAVQRAAEMMTIPMNQLPPLALKYARHLCKIYGGCGEVMLTGFAAYAQCVEGLPCNDSLYKAGIDGCGRELEIKYPVDNSPHNVGSLMI